MAARTSPTARKTGSRRKTRSKDTLRGRVRAHDPFELIRWLALSQPDPRKALAELVQNSFDAGARNIRVTRLRERGLACLRVQDDGDGVIADLDRPEALRYIATHIGHSRKRSLSPSERLNLMTQGQYGIGLLGFWSLGERLEIRSFVPGQRAHRLVLHRDRPEYEIEPMRGRLGLDERRTEVIVVGLHKPALHALVGSRASDYLASELRGQLLARGVELIVEDKLSRGRAQKLFLVRPPRFLGERITGVGPVEVEGHPPIQLEIYLGGKTDTGQATGLGLYSAGTLVAESFHELAILGLDHEPWTDERLCGLVDFPAFRVAPGSRRGVVANDAANAFATALQTIEPVLNGVLEQLERQQAAELDRTVIRDLQRAFRGFYNKRPSYQLLPVHNSSEPGTSTAEGGRGAPTDTNHPQEDNVVQGTGDEDDSGFDTPIGDAQLLPPGPLASVHIRPSKVRVACDTLRTVRAYATDETQRPLENYVEFEWSLTGSVGTLLEDDQGRSGRVRLHAAAEEITGSITVTARTGGLSAVAEVPVEVLHNLGSARANEGIPKPELINASGLTWRSRMHEGQWQVNTAHSDYRAIEDRPAPKLRYLAMLFAKEVVLRSHQDPRLAEPLEQLIEVASFADRNLSAKKTGRRR